VQDGVGRYRKVLFLQHDPVLIRNQLKEVERKERYRKIMKRRSIRYQAWTHMDGEENLKFVIHPCVCRFQN
jgi:hypothetical protein